MHITKRRTNFIIQKLFDKQILVDSCSHYGELNYIDPEQGILFGNWNLVSQRLYYYLEEAGYQCEWDDEWYVDYENDKAWRTSPNSYYWVCQIAFTDDGEVLTPDDPIENWLNEMCMTDTGQVPRALPDWITEADLEEHGYIKHNGEFESGWHPGQTDDPKKIAAFLFGKEDIKQVVFRLSKTSQFYITFEAYYLPKEEFNEKHAA